MLSALLGALSATMLAFAPALVEPSSNLSNNDGNISTVHSAYYDASNVSEYGTTTGQAYNYTSSVLTDENEDSYPVDSSFGWALVNSRDNTHYQLVERSGESYITAVENLTIDLYINGTFIATDNGSGGYYDFFIPRTYQNVTGYVWLFDHYNYQLGTDTVADIADGLTSGIGTVATGIGGGLGSLMQNIFLVGTVDDETGAFTATGLSTFGIVTVVFCGLALALGLSRWVVGFASSLGSRNR